MDKTREQTARPKEGAGSGIARAWTKSMCFLEKKRKGPLPLVLSFLLPFLIFALCLIFQGVYPFGDRQIINYDGWHQYYPFLLKLWDHFHEGTGLLYDWSMGMGTNFLSMLSYYGSSPLNLLLVLVPVREFRVLFTLLVCLRIGAAGLFTGLFLKRIFKNPGWSIAFFAAGYALSGYFLGYYWNNMWLDTVALYPLLCLATVKLFREGKSWLYVLVLALSLFSNYYIGYMSALFTVLVFFALCILDRVGFLDFLKKGFRLLIATLLGAGLTAVLLLPAFFGLLNTVSTTDPAPVYVSFYESVRDLITPLSSFHAPTVMEGLPNLSTAALLSLFAFGFFWAKKIALREKLVFFAVLLFLLFSMNFSVLNYIWHGMHFTNMIPYRFAFLFSFVVVVMAYRYYKTALPHFDWIDAVGMLLFAALLMICAFGFYPNGSVLGTVAVVALAVVALVFCSVGIISRRTLTLFVCGTLTVELCVNAALGTGAVGNTSYSEYFDTKRGEEMETLVEKVKEMEAQSQDFYRMESTEWRSLNDSCFYNYNGISQFASSANVNVSTFLQALGMPADPGSNRFVYVHGTPLADTLLGVKYLVQKSGYLSDTGMTLLSAPKNGSTSALYQTSSFAGLGFLLEEEAGDFQFDSTQKPYEKQNALFRALTGLKGDLFSVVAPSGGEHMGLSVQDEGEGKYRFSWQEGEESSPRVLRFSYTLPQTGMVYIYADVPLANFTQVNNAWHCIEDYPNFFSAGYFREGEEFSLRTVIQEETQEAFSDTATFYVCTMDQALWEEGLEKIKDEKLVITSFEDTEVEGKITAGADGYLYTSIPWEPGAWRVWVDGKEVQAVPFAGSFVGLYLTQGEHTVTFSYSPKGFAIGAYITAGSVLLFVLLCIFEARGKGLFPEKPRALPPETEEKPGEENPGEENDRSEVDESYPEGD